MFLVNVLLALSSFLILVGSVLGLSEVHLVSPVLRITQGAFFGRTSEESWYLFEMITERPHRIFIIKDIRVAGIIAGIVAGAVAIATTTRGRAPLLFMRP